MRCEDSDVTVTEAAAEIKSLIWCKSVSKVQFPVVKTNVKQ